MHPFKELNSIAVARKCFNENLDKYGDALKAPEKYNLYNGLANLATAIEELQSKLKEIEKRITR